VHYYYYYFLIIPGSIGSGVKKQRKRLKTKYGMDRGPDRRIIIIISSSIAIIININLQLTGMS